MFYHENCTQNCYLVICICFCGILCKDHRISRKNSFNPNLEKTKASKGHQPKNSTTSIFILGISGSLNISKKFQTPTTFCRARDLVSFRFIGRLQIATTFLIISHGLICSFCRRKKNGSIHMRKFKFQLPR